MNGNEVGVGGVDSTCGKLFSPLGRKSMEDAATQGHMPLAKSAQLEVREPGSHGCTVYMPASRTYSG